MGMTIEERIAQLARVKHYAAPRHYETLDIAIDTMRKYQKIQQIYLKWNRNYDISTSDAWTELIGVVENGNDD